MASPYTIGGPLPFAAGASSLDFTGSPASLSNSYANAYQSSLGFNQANYNQILSGYQQTLGNQQAAQQGVSAGYGALSNDVLAGINNIGASRSQDIASEYTKQSGAAAQSLISRGLGNTTIQDSVQRGLAFDKGRQDTALANTLAQTRAGYQSQLGLAGLGYAGQAAAQNTDQANRQLNWMNSVSAGYPDASLYARLAQMYGAGQQGAADRAQQQAALGRLQTGGGVTPRGTTSYSPGGTALTGRPDPGSYGGAGGGYGAGLGGGGRVPVMPGNYLGLGTPQSVSGGTDEGTGDWTDWYDQLAAEGGGGEQNQDFGYDFSDNPDVGGATAAATAGAGYGALDAGAAGGYPDLLSTLSNWW